MDSDGCDRARVAQRIGALRWVRFLRPTAQEANGLRIAAIFETNRSGRQWAQMAAIAPGSPSTSARSDSRDF